MISSKIENAPRLRFNGFNIEWEQCKLKDIAAFNPKALIPDVFEYVDLESVVGTQMVSHQTMSKNKAPSRAQRLAKYNDVFYQTVRPYQKNNYIFKLPYDNYVFSTGYAQMRPNIDSYFLFSRLQENNFVNSVLVRSTGTSYPAINTKDLESIKINVPNNNDETVKIGNVFQSLDHLITLHQSKLENLEDTKKGLLQNMFPKNKEKIPKIRFDGFTNDWEQCKLNELAQFSKGKGYSKNDLKDNGSPIILYGRLYTKYETVINDVDTYVDLQDNSILSLGNEVIVPSSGESAEDISRASVIAKKGIIIGGDLNVIKTKSYVNPIFLALTISNGTQKKEMVKRAQGASVVHINNSDLKQINLIYPKYEEQTKIGNLFNSLDHLITLHQDKLEKLQETKKGLLQLLFV